MQPPRDPRRALAACLVAVTAAAGLTACGGDDEQGGGDLVAIDGGYVALGDSYTAAPGVPEADEESTFCGRSTVNYPSLVAERLEATSFTDVSCAGASTLSLVGAQAVTNDAVPAQFEALDADTALVTIGIGGNDADLFATIVGTCMQAAQTDPTGSPCEDAASSGGTDATAATLATIGSRVTSALAGVHDRAPDAQVILVGYPQVVPAEGTCEDLPLAEGDYPYVHQIFEDLDTVLAQAATDADASYVDLLGPSEGHDVCAGDEAWVEGVEADPDDAIALHPFAVEQEAAADLVLEQIS